MFIKLLLVFLSTNFYEFTQKKRVNSLELIYTLFVGIAENFTLLEKCCLKDLFYKCRLYIFHFRFVVNEQQYYLVFDNFKIKNNPAATAFAFSFAFDGNTSLATIREYLIAHCWIFFQFRQESKVIRL